VSGTVTPSRVAVDADRSTVQPSISIVSAGRGIIAARRPAAVTRDIICAIGMALSIESSRARLERAHALRDVADLW